MQHDGYVERVHMTLWTLGMSVVVTYCQSGWLLCSRSILRHDGSMLVSIMVGVYAFLLSPLGNKTVVPQDGIENAIKPMALCGGKANRCIDHHSTCQLHVDLLLGSSITSNISS